MRRSRSLRVWVPLLALLSSACGGDVREPEERPPAAVVAGALPLATETAFDTATVRSAVLRAAAAAQFDSIAGDRQRLSSMVAGVLTPTTSAVIWPQSGACGTPLEHGKILAKAYAPQADRDFGWGPGWNYWVVVGRAGNWYSLFVPEDAATPLRVEPIHVKAHPGYSWKQSFARFETLETGDDIAWVCCSGGDCCCNGPNCHLDSLPR